VTDPRSGVQFAGPIRVRFAPSADGHLHVGDVRTALYGWAFARHTGGAFVLRPDDIGSSEADQRVTEVVETLHWLGFNWDEGPDQGGPYAPYRQGERISLYHQWAQRFLDTGYAYWCYCTTEELQARHEPASPGSPASSGTLGGPASPGTLASPASPGNLTGPDSLDGPTSLDDPARPTAPASPSGPTAPADPAGPAGPAAPAGTTSSDGYDRYCRTLEPDQVQAYLAEGRRPVLRFRMPDGSTTYTDLLRGQITVDHQDVPDFVLMHADGRPLYNLATAVDDATMGITHIIRGEELLFATPRQIAVYRAMGLPEDQFPVFAHLPHLLADGAASIDRYRQQGFVPEALVNYLAGLNWSPPGGRDEFTLDDLVGQFDLAQVSDGAARFDPEQLEALNAAKIRALTPADFARRIVPFLARAGLVTEPLSSDQMWFIRDGGPLIQDRITRLTETPAQLAFLLDPKPDFGAHSPDAAAVLTADAAAPLKAAVDALAALPDWTAPAIEQALQAALVHDLALPPEAAFDPIRVAVTGHRDAPPLAESMALLGREPSLGRLAAAQAALPS
jgi:glutamyl-tRNA synthetase